MELKQYSTYLVEILNLNNMYNLEIPVKVCINNLNLTSFGSVESL